MAEIAVALVLLVGAGLLVRSSFLLSPGFDASGVLTARLSLAEAAYPDAGRVAAAYGRIVDELRTLPGVGSAAAINSLPMGTFSSDVGLQVQGQAFSPDQMPVAHFRVVTPGYLETMRIPVRRAARSP